MVPDSELTKKKLFKVHKPANAPSILKQDFLGLTKNELVLNDFLFMFRWSVGLMFTQDTPSSLKTTTRTEAH